MDSRIHNLLIPVTSYVFLSYKNNYYPTLLVWWTGIMLMPIRIGISIPILIQIQILSLPHVIHMLDLDPQHWTNELARYPLIIKGFKPFTYPAFRKEVYGAQRIPVRSRIHVKIRDQ